jgi:hypothetical protein
MNDFRTLFFRVYDILPNYVYKEVRYFSAHDSATGLAIDYASSK